MIGIVFWTVLMAAAVGLAAKFFLDRQDAPEKISWLKFAIAMAAICVIVAPGIAKIGWEIAKDNLVTYEEYWNGWELAAVQEDITCERDGSCHYCYDCDPYEVPVSYSCNCNDKGECDTCWRTETRYHSCPYVDFESSYFVKTTLGDYTIDTHRFPNHPQSHRWREGEGIPSYVIERAGVGAPAFWLGVKSRVDIGRPGPVSARKKYKNYILASDQTILKQYSSAVDRFAAKGLLPKISFGIDSFYVADKVYFVGYQPADPGLWRARVRYLDAALGSELQGDLHLVVVQNQAISQNPDDYALALRAYWQNTLVFGANALSKNGVVVIVGTLDGATVAWSRAFTGMPIGNEFLEVNLRESLRGLPFNPDAVIGSMQSYFQPGSGGTRVAVVHGIGAIESALWGLQDPKTKFHRYSMSGKSGAGAGFLYLQGEIQPKGYQKFWIFFCAFLASCGLWAACVFIGGRINNPRQSSRYGYY